MANHRSPGAFPELLCIGLSILAVTCTSSCSPDLIAKKAASVNTENSRPSPQNKHLYPYSVVPGGVHSASELHAARIADLIVDRHYLGFGSSPTLVHPDHALSVYISYRIGSEVFWTATKHLIPQGEPLLSDGTQLARARCGNRLSLVPVQPTRPTQEPELDSPEPFLKIAKLLETPELLFPLPYLTGTTMPPAIPAQTPQSGVFRGNEPEQNSQGVPTNSSQLVTPDGFGIPPGRNSVAESQPRSRKELLITPEPITAFTMIIGVVVLGAIWLACFRRRPEDALKS